MNTDTRHTLRNLQLSLHKLDAELHQATRTRGADVAEVHTRYHRVKADVEYIAWKLRNERVSDCFLL